MAFDLRFGVSTHFDRLNSSPNYALYMIPYFPFMGVNWIRDDINWSVLEPTQGNFVKSTDPSKQGWQDSCVTNGVNYIGLIGDDPIPTFYGGPGWPTDATNQSKILTALPNFCAWLVQNEPGMKALEIVNEAQNKTAFQGSAGQQFLFNLTNAVATAVHAARPGMIVLGNDQQGDQIINTLNLGTPLWDGQVYHPYDPGDFIPEHVFTNVLHDAGGVRLDNGSGSTDYLTWINRIRQVTSMPLWETERACSNGGGQGEYISAKWEARRTLLSYWAGIQHTFLYQGIADGFNDKQGFFSFNQQPRMNAFVHQRISQYLPSTFVAAGTQPVGTPGNTLLRQYGFTDGSNYIAALWYQTNVNVTLDNVNPTPLSVVFPIPPIGVPNTITAVNVVSGVTFPLTFSTGGGNVTVNNVPVNSFPLLLVPATGGGGPEQTVGKGYFLSNKQLDYALSAQAWAQPGTLYCALSTTGYNVGGTGGTEVVGNNYARAPLTCGLALWPAAVNGAKSNGQTIQFNSASASWGTITSVALYDAPTGGNVYYFGDLVAPKTINGGDTAQFTTGSFSITE